MCLWNDQVLLENVKLLSSVVKQWWLTYFLSVSMMQLQDSHLKVFVLVWLQWCLEKNYLKNQLFCTLVRILSCSFVFIKSEFLHFTTKKQLIVWDINVSSNAHDNRRCVDSSNAQHQIKSRAIIAFRVSLPCSYFLHENLIMLS